MSKATDDWKRISDKYYRKTQLYTSVFDANLELENYIVTGAPYSGAVGRHSHSNFAMHADWDSSIPP